MASSSSRAARGTGAIHKRTVTRNGQQYTYWEGRVTVGRDPGTGKQKQHTFSGKTQREVREKMQEASVEVNDGTYQDPKRITVGEWLDLWMDEYMVDVKQRTLDSYRTIITTHLKPAFGAVRLQELSAPEIQRFYNTLRREGMTVAVRDENGKRIKRNGKTVYKNAPMSPKSVKNVHGVLHSALKQAIEIGYIRHNPSESCRLPRIEKPDISPLDSEDIQRFLAELRGHPFENIYIVTLFTGLRQGEVLGLTWDCVDFENGTLTVKQQLQRVRKQGTYDLASTKTGKHRRLKPAPTVMQTLKNERARQAEKRLRAGDLWSNPLDLVFTNEVGRYISAQTLYLKFKDIAAAIGRPDARFHDLRHSFAVLSLESGDDIKTLQENLGHYSSAFTLDVYGHVTDRMKQESSRRIEQYIKDVSGGSRNL